jgi:hypothetical protein
MKIQTKLFSWPEKGNHIILIAQGVLDARGLEQILAEVGAVAIPQLHCKVLIDLTNAHCTVARGEIDQLLREPRPDLWLLRECKTALVCSRENDQYNRLSVVSASLEGHGFRMAVFRDSKAAVVWLADGT